MVKNQGAVLVNDARAEYSSQSSTEQDCHSSPLIILLCELLIIEHDRFTYLLRSNKIKEFAALKSAGIKIQIQVSVNFKFESQFLVAC